LGLVKALEKSADTYRGKDLRTEIEPSLVVCCAAYEDVAEEVQRVRDLLPDVPILVMGLSVDVRLARGALQSRARGYIHAGMQPSHVVRALELAMKGEVVIPREMITDLITQEEPADLHNLTARQHEILRLVAEGLTNAQIAQRLFLSEFTVKQHLRAAYKTLGVKNRTEASRLIRRGPDP
jgi:DNA-binding NarL/FixJ family response regulator